MHNTSERIIELFGESNESPLFLKFIADLGEPPHILLNTEKVVEYDFALSGFHLTFRQAFKSGTLSPRLELALVIFILGKSYTVYSDHKPFSGRLSFSLMVCDSPEKVQEKIGIAPFRTQSRENELEQSYLQSGMEIWCGFRYVPNLSLTMLSLKPSKTPSMIR